jgi:transposase
MSSIHRHDITDDVWERLKPHLPGSKGNMGRRGRNNRLFMDAIVWKLRTGVPWRDLPHAMGTGRV